LIPVVVRPHSTVVIYGTMPEATIPAAFCLVNSITLKFFLVYVLTQGEREAAIGTIMRAIELDRLMHNVAKTFPFAEMAEAHEAVESGTVPGNVVVTIPYAIRCPASIRAGLRDWMSSDAHARPRDRPSPSECNDAGRQLPGPAS
jgi:hypothetical protein